MEKSIYSDKQKILINLLKESRISAGLSQKKVSELIGRPQSFVSKYESGERRLDLIELHQICSAIGMSLPKFTKIFEQNISKTINK